MPLVLAFANLGSQGRLGNQLFQIAATAAYAADLGVRCVMLPWEYAPYFAPSPGGDDCFVAWLAVGAALPLLTAVAEESGFAHRESDPGMRASLQALAAAAPSDRTVAVSLKGYFQSELYFAPRHERAVRALFSPHPSVMERLSAKYANVLASRPRSCALHVRRGDYIWNHARHPLQPVSYYADALRALYCGEQQQQQQQQQGPEGVVILVFSDDIPWCKRHLAPALPGGVCIEHVEGNADIVDMFLMSRCDDHVIANSSFSWWGAWLCERPGKRVVAPLPRWFGPAAPLRTDDILPAGWMAM